MTRCLIKKWLGPSKPMNNKAFTLLEMLMAVGFTVLLMAGVYGFYNTSAQVYSSGISGEALQGGANIILSKIINGATEFGTVYRLSTAVSYVIPNGNTNYLYSCGAAPQIPPCNANNPSGEIYFCQDAPCLGPNDLTARWYYLNSNGTSIIYHHPSATGIIDENIFTAPEGSTLKLRFSPATVNINSTNVVEIDVALLQNVADNVTNNRIAASGAASTFVLLRNHP